MTTLIRNARMLAAVHSSAVEPPLYFGLLFASTAFDANFYFAGVAHVYVHDMAAVVVAFLGLRLALRRGSVVPVSHRVLIPLVVLLFLIANTVVSAALTYPSVPPEMRKLFWFEHGDALRIVGELVVWIWTLALLAPGLRDPDQLLDLAGWACLGAIALIGLPWLLESARPEATTVFDLCVLVGFPIALYFVVRRSRMRDYGRLFIYSLATTLLYSRTTIVGAAIASVVLAAVLWRPRRVVLAFGVFALAWAIVLVPRAAESGGAMAAPSAAPTENATPKASPSSLSGTIAAALSQRSEVTIRRTKSLVDQSLAPYTIPSRAAIWSDALRIAGLSPLFGVGYHDYFLYSRVTEIKDASIDDVPGLFSSLIKQGHNDFLSWLAETGAIGMVLYLFLWGFLIRETQRRMGGATQGPACLAFGLAIGLLAVSAVGEILVPRSPEWMPAATIWWLVLTLPLLDRTSRSTSH